MQNLDRETGSQGITYLTNASSLKSVKLVLLADTHEEAQHSKVHFAALNALSKGGDVLLGEHSEMTGYFPTPSPILSRLHFESWDVPSVLSDFNTPLTCFCQMAEELEKVTFSSTKDPENFQIVESIVLGIKRELPTLEIDLSNKEKAYLEVILAMRMFGDHISKKLFSELGSTWSVRQLSLCTTISTAMKMYPRSFLIAGRSHLIKDNALVPELTELLTKKKISYLLLNPQTSEVKQATYSCASEIHGAKIVPLYLLFVERFEALTRLAKNLESKVMGMTQKDKQT